MLGNSSPIRTTPQGRSSPTGHAVRTPAAALLVLLAVEVDVDGATLGVVELEEVLHLLEAPCRYVFGHYAAVFRDFSATFEWPMCQ